MRNLVLYIFCLFLFSLAKCSNENTENVVIEKINIEASLDNFSVIDLSCYVARIRYVKLENNENSLVTDGIKNIFLEDDKLFVHDWEPFLKVFDASTGKYLYNIGEKGQGPGELSHLSYVDINAQTKKILLSWSKITNEFDFEGNFLGAVNKPEQDTIQIINYNVTSLSEDLFAAGIQNYTDYQENAIVIFNRKKQIVNVLKSHEAPIKHPQFKTWNSLEEGGFFYHIDFDTRFFRGISDTIYTYNVEEGNFIPFYSLFFGKHRSNHNHNPNTEKNNVITIKSIIESQRYLFMDFYIKQAPEPFEESIWMGDHFRRFKNHYVYGVYDKVNKKLNYLLQPIPTKQGLKNDIDNSVPFWPKSVSSSGEMIDYCQAYDFLEYAEKVINPDKSLTEVLEDLDEEDNPIVIIATPL